MQSVDKACLCEFRDDAAGVGAVANATAARHLGCDPGSAGQASFSVPPLCIPLQRLRSIADLAATFRVTEVTVGCAGAAALAGGSGLIEKLRGALGVSLHETASPAVRAGGGCTWSPPCACQVLWHPQGEVRPGFNVPSPFVLLADTRGQDLWLTVRLFGLACDYLGEVGEALIRALSRGLSGIAPRGLRADQRTFLAGDGVAIPAIRSQAELRFLTPMLIRGSRPDVPVDPAAFLRGLIHRVDGMARWHGAQLEKDLVVALIDAATSVESRWKETTRHSWRRGAVQQGRSVPMQGALGSLYLRGDLAPFAALIGLGELTFAGSRTAFGQGRYTIGHRL